jgi:hypothetical protein
VCPFANLPTDQKVFLVQNYVIMAGALLAFWNIFVGVGIIVAAIAGVQYALMKRENRLLKKHQGELFFDTFTFVDNTLCQDMIYPFKNPVALPLNTEVARSIPFLAAFEKALVFVMKKNRDTRDPQEVLLKLQTGIAEIHKKYCIVPEPPVPPAPQLTTAPAPPQLPPAPTPPTQEDSP